MKNKVEKSKTVYGKDCLLESISIEQFKRDGITETKYKMDGILFLKKFPKNSIPCVFFDPQYRGILDKMDYGNEGERQKARAGLEQMDESTILEFVRQIDRVLVPSGHLFLWIDKFHLLNGFRDWLSGTDLEVVDLITWNKMKIGMGYRTRRTGEYLVVIQKSPKKAKGIWSIHNIPDVWNEQQKKHHAHAKPIKLQSELIAAVTKPGDVIIDPAAGSYSVMESAQVCGRNFIGCDLV